MARVFTPLSAEQEQAFRTRRKDNFSSSGGSGDIEKAPTITPDEVKPFIKIPRAPARPQVIERPPVEEKT